jgi:hypothetical protein
LINEYLAYPEVRKVRNIKEELSKAFTHIGQLKIMGSYDSWFFIVTLLH